MRTLYGLLVLPLLASPAPVPPTLEQRLDAISAQLAAAAAAPAPVLPAETLPRLRSGRLFDWRAAFFPSQWGNQFSTVPWRDDHVATQRNGDVAFTLDATGGAEVQGRGGTVSRTAGRWEVDVDLPKPRSGVVQAPLWLYDTDTKSGNEVDFEIAGLHGLDITLHQSGSVTDSIRIAGDFTGRHRFAIAMDQAQGFVETYVDGKLVKRWDKATAPIFVTHAMKPIFSIWSSDPAQGWLAGWLGPFTPFAPGEKMVMTIHGYRYTPL